MNNFYEFNIENKLKLFFLLKDSFDRKPNPGMILKSSEKHQINLNKSLMVGDSEVDSMAASSADIPFILVEDGYTDKNINQIPHKHLIKDFVGIEKIISSYLNDNT